MDSLKRSLDIGGYTREVIAFEIRNSFSGVEWSKAENREDRNTYGRNG